MVQSDPPDLTIICFARMAVRATVGDLGHAHAFQAQFEHLGVLSSMLLKHDEDLEN